MKFPSFVTYYLPDEYVDDEYHIEVVINMDKVNYFLSKPDNDGTLVHFENGSTLEIGNLISVVQDVVDDGEFSS